MHVLGGGFTESEGAMCALLISLSLIEKKNTKTSFTITFGVDIASMCYMYMHMYTTV